LSQALSPGTVLGLIAIFALSVSFDYINGFHDTANAIATSVSTRALKPEYALLLSAAANFVGALVFGTAVATTIGSGVVQDNMILGDGATVLAAALLGAIAWNLITWALAIPSSSSHALVGGLIGAAIASAGPNAVQWGNFFVETLQAMMPSAWARRNSVQLGPVRRGAGPSRAVRSKVRIVVAPTRRPSLRSSPSIRTQPQRGFSRARRRMSVRIAASIRGRPGRPVLR